MNYLFFDTETNSKYQTSARLIHLAFIKTDETGKELQRFSELVRPMGFQIDNSEIHGITQEVALKNGVSAQFAIHEFMAALANCSLLVAHNIDYDKKVVFNELKALGLIKTHFNTLYNVPTLCTMQSSTAYCDIRDGGRERPKFPRLSELYKKLFDKEYPQNHHALTDVEAAMHCFFELKERKVILGA
ncbi:MAG: 3'-5' exonuclease [Bacteroidota bacterium]